VFSPTRGHPALAANRAQRDDCQTRSLAAASGFDSQRSCPADVGTPTTYVDILDEHVTGANVLSNAQFEVIASFALSRVIAIGSGAIGAIPLPSLCGVAVTDLGITEQPATSWSTTTCSNRGTR
jgi:hypothetical protein